MATKIQVRRDAAADWTSTNPTLAAGEIGFESDTNKFKIGDGTTAWTSLAYAPQDYITGSSTTTFTNKTFDANGTGNSISNIETADFATAAFKDEDTMSSNSATAVASQQSIKAYVDAEDANIASDTLTFTNKTFDANGTGNSISNIETADIAAATLVTAAEGIGSNNNDTTIPTSAAVKAYADSVGGGGGGTITALNNQAENRLVSIGATTTELDGEANLTFDGSTLTLTGSAALDGVTIADNLITTNRSNDDLNISANGSGRINAVSPLQEATLNFFGAESRVKGFRASYENTSVNADTLTDREYGHTFHLGSTLTNGSSTNNNFRPRALVTDSIVDLDGNSYTRASLTRGPLAQQISGVAQNSSGTNATIYSVRGVESSACIFENSGAAGDITVNNAIGNHSLNEFTRDGAGNMTVDNSYGFLTDMFDSHSGTGTSTVTNGYGYYVNSLVGTNQYAFYDATNSTSVFGDIQTQAVSITDNLITTNRSNDNLNISANGSGRVDLIQPFEEATLWSNPFGSTDRIQGFRAFYQDLALNPNNLTERNYGHAIGQETKITADSSNSNFRPRALILGSVLDMDGFDYTNTSFYRGPLGMQCNGTVMNTAATDSEIQWVRAADFNAGIADFNNSNGALLVHNAAALFLSGGVEGDGAGNLTVTNHYGFFIDKYNDHGGAGTGTITNSYGIYVNSLAGSNQYAFYDATNSLSVFGDIQTQAVSITDNLITSNRSNDNLLLEGNGSGVVSISSNGTHLEYATLYNANHGSHGRVKGLRASFEKSTDANTVADREYGHALHYGNTLTNGSSTNNNFRPRGTIVDTTVDLAGNSYTVASVFRGPLGMQVGGYILNNSATNATIATVRGVESSAGVADMNNAAGNLTITNAIGNHAANYYQRNGTGDLTITNSISFRSQPELDYNGTGTATITNHYGFYNTALDSFGSGGGTVTNEYAFYDAGNKLSRFGAVILANQSGDPSTVTDSAHIYAKDVASSSEVFVRDEAGNVTQISPHNEQGEWQYWSENIKTGKKVRINMERMIRKLEEITGETFIENE